MAQRWTANPLYQALPTGRERDIVRRTGAGDLTAR
jgi:hypothetical protein